MKVVLKDIPKRIVFKPFTTEGIIGYDIDNAYPQRVVRMVGASGTARNCVNLYAKFMAGMSFRDDLTGDAIINRDGDTANIMFSEETTPDFAHYGGFACHINYNLLFQKTSISSIPFETSRLVLPDLKKGYGKMTHIALYNDWGREHHSRIKHDKIQFLDVFNDDPKVIAEQIQKAGGIKNYKGQVFWYSNQKKGYPIPIFDPVLEDIDTDSQLKVHSNSNVRTGFSASHLLIHKGKFESDEERDEFNDTIAEFQGPDVAGSIMVIEVETEDQIPELIPVKSQLNEKVIKVTNDNTKNNIIEMFQIPAILVNANEKSGITFSDDNLKLAYDYYNSITAPERKMLERQFTKLFKNFHKPLGTFEIVPLEWIVSIPTPTV